jgi:hypothetical protein
VSYYFAGLIFLFGESVVVLHAGMIPWLIAAGWSIGRLESRFCGSAGWGTLLVLLGPAVVVGTNLMLDVPLLACTAFAVEMCCRGLERSGRRSELFLASVAATGAVLIKYSGVVVLAIFAAALWQYRRRAIGILVLPALALGTWQVASRNLYGAAQVQQGLTFLSQFRFEALRMLGERTLTMFALLALTLPLWIAVPLRRRLWVLSVVIAAGCSIAGLVLFDSPWPPDVWIVFPVAVFLGAWMVVCVLLLPPHTNDTGIDPRPICRVWLVGYAAFAILFGPFVAVRSFLPVQVPLVLLAGFLIPPERRGGRWATMVATAVISFGTGWADYRWASFYADAAQRLARSYPPDKQPVFFLGHWGWQYYAERAGFLAWDARMADVPTGAVVIIPHQADKQWIAPSAAARLELVEEIVLGPHPLGVSTWRRERGIRFYGGDYGELPWWFSAQSAEVLRVYRAVPAR